MEDSAQLLLDVWREVCRHIAIDEAVGRLTPVLMRRFPLDELLVRHIDVPRRCIDTLAEGLLRPTTGRLGATGGSRHAEPARRCTSGCRGSCPRA